MLPELVTGPEPRPDIPIPGMQIWGWTSNIELLWLGETAARMGSIVEIGCLHGRSAFALLTACPGPVYCVDPWDDDADASYPSFLSNCGHFENLRPVKDSSLVIAASGPPITDGIDMTFLDGSHAYESVLADISAWLPLTRRLLCGHDYSNADGGYPGVSKAVDEVFGDRVYVPEGTSIWTVDLEADRSVEASAPVGPRAWTDEYGKAYEYDLRWPL